MRSPTGFTLAETIVAAALVAVGVAALAVVLPLTGYGLREGRYVSAAVFLAEERLEQARGNVWDAARDCLGTSASVNTPPTTTACPGFGPGHLPFPDEEPGALPAPFEPFRRVVRIASCGVPGACPVESDALRLVTVSVSYTPTSGRGAAATPGERPVVVRGLQARQF